ncbi:hypothetical protein ACFFRR_009512 [Megaselia abdita]
MTFPGRYRCIPFRFCIRGSDLSFVVSFDSRGDVTGISLPRTQRVQRPYCANCQKYCRQTISNSTFCAICRRQGFTTETCNCSVQSTSGLSNPPQANSTAFHGDTSLTDNRPKREIQVLGKTFHALLDSGATTSYVNKKARAK